MSSDGVKGSPGCLGLRDCWRGAFEAREACFGVSGRLKSFSAMVGVNDKASLDDMVATSDNRIRLSRQG